jgi:hypothetical protein
MSLQGSDLPAVALAQARQGGTTEAISQSIENKGIAALLPPPRESLAMTKRDCRPAFKEREKRYS